MVRGRGAGTVGCFLLGRAEKEGRPLLAAEASPGGELIKQVVPDKLLKKLVAIELADEAASVVVVCDIGRVFGKQVTDDLIDGVIPFFTQRAVYGCEQRFHLLIGFIGNYKFDRIVVHIG